MKKPKIIVIAGPTSSGKSDLAVKLALEIGGEIVSMDSRQIYKGLDIGTGKITDAEMRGVPHHMIDIVSPRTRYTVQQFKNRAQKEIAGILRRGKVPILTGGSGMYIDAVVYNKIFPEVPPNKKLRIELEKMSTEDLQKILKKKDPKRFANVDIMNRARLIRSIEIAEKLGKVPEAKNGPKLYDVDYRAIKIPKNTLEKKIAQRFNRRFNEGLLKEVKKLRRKGISWKRFYDLGLEYRLAAEHLQGKISEKEMREKMLRENIKYAKRQMTWFKKNKDIKWISGGSTRTRT